MNTTHSFSLLRGACLAFFLSACLTQAVSAQPFTLIDGEGFETYALGDLEGQFTPTFGGAGNAPWVRTGATSTAVVQTATVESGAQAVEINRAANSDDRWGVPITGAPGAGSPFVVIEWDMYVASSTPPSGSFAPFFGVEAYDASSSLLRIASLGVDAGTGDVLATLRDDGVQLGFLVDTGADVVLDSWNSFDIVLDYTTDTYTAFVNSTAVFTSDFEQDGANQFTDAPLTAIASFGDPISLAATGTAFFDNYVVTEVPEPASLALLTVSLGLGLAARRKSK